MDRLYKSRNDKIFDGVCGGIAQYFGIDPVIIRMLWVLLVLFGGTGVLAYLVAMIIIPKEPEITVEENQEDEDKAVETYSQKFWGILLIIVGVFLLIGLIGPVGGLFAGAAVLMSSVFWPLLVIVLGLYLFFGQGGGDYKSQISEVFPPGKKLCKSVADRKISGICGGIGEYFNIDSNIIRIFWVMATLGSFGFGVLAYLVLALFLEDGE